MANKYFLNVFNILDHQRNANENYSETLSHPCLSRRHHNK